MIATLQLTTRPPAETRVRRRPLERSLHLGRCVAWNSALRLVALLLLMTAAAASPRAQTVQGIQYTYDAMQRLVEARYPDGASIHYLYDRLGNRLIHRVTAAPGAPNQAPGSAAPGISDGAVNVSTSATLTWAPAADPDAGDGVAYFVRFGISPDPPLVFSGTQTSWSPGPLRCFTKYYWAVSSRDSQGAESRSPTWSFTTGNTPPRADFEAVTRNGMAPFTVRFQDRTFYDCGALTTWRWDFNSDGVVDATSSAPAFTFTQPGDYTVKLDVTDEHGGASTVTKAGYVSVLGPNIVDLKPVHLQVQSAGSYRNLIIGYAVTNQGTVSLAGYWQWSDGFYAAAGPVLDAKSTILGSFDERHVMAAASGYARTNMVAIPLFGAVPSYLQFKADSGNQIPEANEADNVLALPITSRLPDLIPGNLQIAGEAVAGQPLTVRCRITNQGALDIAGLQQTEVDFVDGIYLSSNATWNASAMLIAAPQTRAILPIGASYSLTNDVTLPSWPPGQYYLFVRANSGDFILESDPVNNTVALPISVAAPDLTPMSARFPANTPSDARAEITFTVTNQGAAPAAGFWADELFLSKDTLLDKQDVSLGMVFQETPVPVGASYSATNSVRLPGWPAGNYYLLIEVDSWNTVADAARNNNVLALPITLLATAGLPDLVPFSLKFPEAALPGETITSVYTVTNGGGSPMVGNWFDLLSFSTNASTTGGALVAFESVEGPLGIRGTYARTNEVFIPKVPAGTYYLILQVNGLMSAEEASATNNVLAVPLLVKSPDLLADLTPVSLKAPASGSVGETIDLVYTVTNRGGADITGSWVDALWLSSEPIVGGGASSLSMVVLEDTVVRGGSYVRTNSFRVPQVEPGEYYLVFKTDAFEQLNEGSSANNLLARPFTVLPGSTLPDLVARLTAGPVSALPGQSVQVAFAVTNLGSSTASAPFVEQLFLSDTPDMDGSETELLGFWTFMSSLAPGKSYTRNATVALPKLAEGDYYLVLNVMAPGIAMEANLENNLAVRPIVLGPNALTAPRFLSVTWSAERGLQLRIEANPGSSYTLLGSTDLVHWGLVMTWDCSKSPDTLNVPAAAGAGRRFYRLSSP